MCVFVHEECEVFGKTISANWYGRNNCIEIDEFEALEITLLLCVLSNFDLLIVEIHPSQETFPKHLILKHPYRTRKMKNGNVQPN